MARLSEANYSSRRINLTEALAGAQAAYSDAAFRAEVGEGTDDAVKAASDNIATIEGRIVGLDAAWQRVKDEVTAERLQAEADERAAVVSLVDKAFKRRQANAVNISKAAERLASLYAEHIAAGEEILAAVRPHAQHLGADNYIHMASEIRGPFTDPRRIIAGTLAAHGLDLSGIGMSAAQFGSADTSVEHHVTTLDQQARNRIAPLEGDDESEG